MTGIDMFNQLSAVPQRQHHLFVVRHPLYGRISLSEPKQKIAGRHGTDTGALGVVSETLEEIGQCCRLAESNGEEMENVYRMAKRL